MCLAMAIYLRVQLGRCLRCADVIERGTMETNLIRERLRDLGIRSAALRGYL